MMSALHDRIAKALGWSTPDAQSLSMASLRDLVRPINPDLANEISHVIQSGAYIVQLPQTKRQQYVDRVATGEPPSQVKMEQDADEVIVALVAAGHEKAVAAETVWGCGAKDRQSVESWTRCALRRVTSVAAAISAKIPKFKIAGAAPATMTATQINKELDKLDGQGSQLGQAMIDAGRGYERPSEYLRMTDPLALELRKNADRRMSLRIEIEFRYGPGAPSRLPSGRGFGPRKS